MNVEEDLDLRWGIDKMMREFPIRSHEEVNSSKSLSPWYATRAYSLLFEN